MGIEDRAGRNLHEGQLVDVVLAGGFYTATVVKVQDNVVSLPGQPPHPKSVLVGVLIPVPVDQRNICNGVYVLKQPESSDGPNAGIPEELKKISPN